MVHVHEDMQIAPTRLLTHLFPVSFVCTVHDIRTVRLSSELCRLLRSSESDNTFGKDTITISSNYAKDRVEYKSFRNFRLTYTIGTS